MAPWPEHAEAITNGPVRSGGFQGVDERVLSLYAKGLTTREISSHFAEIYGASVSKETISRITDKVIEEMTGWQYRPLDESCMRPSSWTRS